ncbi:hypothetical protein ACHAWF_010800 [Thalassiosira exigua]
MTLFAALASKGGAAGGGEGGGSAPSPVGSSASSSPSSPPEAIQLHAGVALDFRSGTVVRPSASTIASAAERGGAAGDGAGGGSGTSEAGSDGGRRSRSFAALEYQAVQTQRDDAPPSGPVANAAAPAGGGKEAVARAHPRPDLGVWTCRVLDGDGSREATIVGRAALRRGKRDDRKIAGAREGGDGNDEPGEEKKGEEGEVAARAKDDDRPDPPVLMTVDLSDPTEVQPAVERMRRAILKLYDGEEDGTSGSGGACTTSVKALQKSTFGRAKIQEDVAVKGGAISSERRMALIVAAIVPTATNSASSTAEEFLERQTRALLSYHLHKFALEADCTLCFVGEGVPSGGSSGDDGGRRRSTVSVDELGEMVRRASLGLSPVDEAATSPADEGDGGEGEGGGSTATTTSPAAYPPGAHDAELIHGAYLRNASCEGRWDAAADDLAAALPPKSSSSARADRGGKGPEDGGEGDASAKEGGGDDAWLSKLASSAGVSTDPSSAAAAAARGGAKESTTPSASDRRDKLRKEKSSAATTKKRPGRTSTARNKDGKPKDEKEVMNFFDNLLKK